MTDTGSSVPRRQLGRYLKLAREEAGIALEAAAKELEWSRARMYRIEGGHSSVRSLDVQQMCTLYGTEPEMTEVLVSLAKQSKSRGWWQAYGDAVPDWFELYVGLEAAASRLRQYEPALIPGLLQTREYAARVLGSQPGMTEDAVAQAVAVRLERQQLLNRRKPRAPELDVILDEGVLHRQWPGRRDQLAQLLTAAQRPGITIRVVPGATSPHHTSLAGAFVVLDFPRVGNRPPEPTTVYSESLTGALYLDRPREVTAYSVAWEMLEGQALDSQRSEALIAAVKESVDDE
jgi:transcriptional regulator with XRE-family HTH domain